MDDNKEVERRNSTGEGRETEVAMVTGNGLEKTMRCLDNFIEWTSH